MSIPEITLLEKKTFKPFLKLNIGDQVFLKSDKKRQFPMLIIDFELEDINCNDYLTTWLDTNGKKQIESFPEECLTIK